MCVTVPEPVANDVMLMLAPCGSAPNQKWNYSTTMFASSAPNVSGAFMLPVHADSPEGWGWTFGSNAWGPSNPIKGTALALFDIGSRFTGECKGHHNCNFKTVAAPGESGQVHTYFPGQCLGTVSLPAPDPQPKPAPPPPSSNCTGVCFSPTLGSHMVLQQSPAVAAVYGYVGAGNGGDNVVIQVTVAPAATKGGGAAPPYTVVATITPATSWSGSGKGWKALLKPHAAGSDAYTITAACTSGCKGDGGGGAAAAAENTVAIQDVTFGQVWYCAGQSNMALPLLHTFSRNLSVAAINSGKYDNIRIKGSKGNMNSDQAWTRLKDAVANNTFFSFSSTCYYFGAGRKSPLATKNMLKG